MIVKIKVRYRDTELGREVNPGEVLTVSDERGERLLRKKIADFLGDGAGIKELAVKDAKIAELEAKIAELEKALKKKA